MRHNALSRSIEQIPMWVIQTVAGIMLSSILAWGAWATVAVFNQASRISVAEQKVDTVKDDIKEIKDDQRDMSDKIDRFDEKLDRVIMQKRR